MSRVGSCANMIITSSHYYYHATLGGLIITWQFPAPSYYRLSGQNACNTPFMTQTSVAFQTVVGRLGIQQFVSLLIECPSNQSLTILAHHHLVSLLLSGVTILVLCRGIKLGPRSQISPPLNSFKVHSPQVSYLF